MAKKPQSRRNAYSDVLAQLDLSGSLVALERNDLLPPRAEDGVGGGVAERFAGALESLIARGRYEPDRCLIVPVPKASYASRPAALMTAADRVVYHSLVEPLRGLLEKRLVSPAAVFWPRAETSPPQWTDFESAAPAAAGSDGYVVRADVAGFYESIDHEILRERLITLTGRTALVDVLIEFLGQVMGTTRGLPQGVATSDVLATTHLSSVDAGMLRAGYRYWRHGDDVRVAVANHDEGRRAVHDFEGFLRAVRLLLNSAKTRVLKHETYQGQLNLVANERRLVMESLVAKQQEDLMHTEVNDAKITSLVGRAGIDEETQWALIYHQTIDLEDIIDQLRDHLKPTDVELAAAMFRVAVDRAPRSDAPPDAEGPLGTEEFHGMLSSSLTTLIAARDERPLPDVASLIARFPAETELLATYLRAVARAHPTEVCEQVEEALSARYNTGWQQAWLLNVLRHVATESYPLANVLIDPEPVLRLARDEETSWLARVEAARLLAALGDLKQELLSRLWAAAPGAVRADLAAAVAVAASIDDPQSWAVAFCDSLREDPVLDVVLSRTR